MTTALAIENLVVTYANPQGSVRAVDGASLVVGEGECVALVGESGSGKSTIAAATLAVLPPSATVSGRVVVAGHDIVAASERERRALRGQVVSLVPQDTGAAMNPVVPVVDQVGEYLRVHRGLSRKAARAEAAARLVAVGVDARVAEHRLLPDELSGGMRQRALLAGALSLGPALVVADEPTSALDPESTLGVVDTLTRLGGIAGSAVLFVTHDLGVARAVADRIVVLYGGRVMEDGPTPEVLSRPRHPYTQGLAAATPSLTALDHRPQPIGGEPNGSEEPGRASTGCPFAPRCPLVVDRCWVDPPERVPVGPGHLAACHLVEKIDG